MKLFLKFDCFKGKDLKTIHNIQALRGIAVLMVVLFHLVTVEIKYGGAYTILPKIIMFGMFGVDLFFVISGFIMVAITQGKFQNAKKASRYLYKRISRIYPLYWFYTLLVLFVFLLKPTWVNSSQAGQVDILASFLLFPSKTTPLVMVGWTLIHEMYFYFMFFINMLFISEQKLPFALIIWGLGIIIINIFFSVNSPVGKLVTHPLTFEFILGCFLALLYYNDNNVFVRFSNGLVLLIMTVSALISAILGYYYYTAITGNIEPLRWWRVLIFGVPAVLIVYGITNAERMGYISHADNLINRIGDASYSIYLSHILTLSALGRVWSIFSNDNIYDNLIMLPVLLSSAIIVGFISYHIIEKPLLKISRKPSWL